MQVLGKNIYFVDYPVFQVDELTGVPMTNGSVPGNVTVEIFTREIQKEYMTVNNIIKTVIQSEAEHRIEHSKPQFQNVYVLYIGTMSRLVDDTLVDTTKIRYAVR